MKLNALGRAAMNNPARPFFQRRLVVPVWLQMAGPVTGGRVLEVGCGRGIGSDIVREALGATAVYGLDLDPKMLSAARKRQTRTGLLCGDVTALPVLDHSLDAVVDFGAIHLVPTWVSALREVRRVLRAGGRYYFEWVTLPIFRYGYRLISAGFERMSPPRAPEIIRALDELGLSTGDRIARRRVSASTQLVGDFIGVATAT